MHTTIRSHTCFSAGSRLHGILQPPWLSVMSKIHKLKQSHALTFQICANLSFTWWNQHHRRAPQPSTTKTQKLGPEQQPHMPHTPLTTSEPPHTSPKISRPRLDHSHTCRHVSLIARRSVNLRNMEVIGCYTCLHMLKVFLNSPPRSDGLLLRATRVNSLLLMSS